MLNGERKDKYFAKGNTLHRENSQKVKPLPVSPGTTSRKGDVGGVFLTRERHPFGLQVVIEMDLSE